MASILDYSPDAKYNIKAVSQKTDIQSVTIRAWERRYQLLAPQRSDNGYRLYSDRDIAILNWVKKQVDSGISISAAVKEFTLAVKGQKWPEAVITEKGPISTRINSGQDLATLSQQLATALTRTDERMSSDIFSEVLGETNLLQLFESVLTPVLVEIGARWERGEVSVAVEHFASQLIQGKIQGIYHSLPLYSSALKVMVGCAPDELHEIGSLMFATLLRDAGYRVEYLGPDIPLNDLAAYAGEEKPRLLVVAATITESAQQLVNFSGQLEKINPVPIFGYGGSAFIRSPRLTEQISGVYLGNNMADSLTKVGSLLPLRNLIRQSL
jgi:methanogenic corrinoid protein MtbC1